MVSGWVSLHDGVMLHHEEHGDPQASLTVVLLHGWTLDRRIWGRQIEALPVALDRPVRIIAADLRGHGRSRGLARRAATLDRLADDLAELLAAAVPGGQVVLVGHSMGGMTIMEYAHRHPADFAARVAGVVLVATTAEGALHTTYGLGPRMARLIRVAEMAGARVLARSGAWRPHRVLAPVLRLSMRWLLFGTAARREDVRLTATAVMTATLRAIGSFRPSIDAQRRLEALAGLGAVPAAVLVGSRDRLTPIRCAENIAAIVPGATLTVCLDAGHMLPLERPDDVTAAIVTVAARL